MSETQLTFYKLKRLQDNNLIVEIGVTFDSDLNIKSFSDSGLMISIMMCYLNMDM